MGMGYNLVSVTTREAYVGWSEHDVFVALGLFFGVSILVLLQRIGSLLDGIYKLLLRRWGDGLDT
jgi:hypothetical protein